MQIRNAIADLHKKCRFQLFIHQLAGIEPHPGILISVKWRFINLRIDTIRQTLPLQPSNQILRGEKGHHVARVLAGAGNVRDNNAIIQLQKRIIQRRRHQQGKGVIYRCVCEHTARFAEFRAIMSRTVGRLTPPFPLLYLDLHPARIEKRRQQWLINQKPRASQRF